MSLFLVRLSVEKGILSIFFLFSICFTVLQLFVCLLQCAHPHMNTHKHTHTHTHTHTHHTTPHHTTPHHTTTHTHSLPRPHCPSPPTPISLSLSCKHIVITGYFVGETNTAYLTTILSILSDKLTKGRQKARKSLRQWLQLERLQKAFTDSVHCSQVDCSYTGHLALSCRLCLFFWWDPQLGAVDQRLSKHSTAWCVGARMYPFSSRVHEGDHPVLFLFFGFSWLLWSFEKNCSIFKCPQCIHA